MPSRDDAWKLLCEYTQSESLRKHMLAVEACVRAYARKNGATRSLGLAAFFTTSITSAGPTTITRRPRTSRRRCQNPARTRLHRGNHPRHPLHADYTNVQRQSPLERTLFACDELAGFITACSYVRPSKSVLDLEASSVKKRLKDKAFARGVSREDVIKGAEELGVPSKNTSPFASKPCALKPTPSASAATFRRNPPPLPKSFMSLGNWDVR